MTPNTKEDFGDLPPVVQKQFRHDFPLMKCSSPPFLSTSQEFMNQLLSSKNLQSKQPAKRNHSFLH